MNKFPLILLPSFFLALVVHAESPVPEAPENVTREFMTKKDFAGEDLAGDKYFQVRLNEAKFRDTNLAGTRFEQCDLSNANFRGALLNAKTVFNKVSMNDADLEGLDLQGAQFDSVNLRGANLKDVKNFGSIVRTSFDGADLRGADLSGVSIPLDEVTFENALYDEKTKFPEGVDPQAAGAVKAS